jgi:hypothetical protein
MSMVGTELSTENAARVNEILRHTPATAQPHGGFGKRPSTVEDLIDTMETMSTYLKASMKDLQANLDTQALVRRVADLQRAGERTEEGALNMAQLDKIISDARHLRGEPVRRPDYDAEENA